MKRFTSASVRPWRGVSGALLCVMGGLLAVHIAWRAALEPWGATVQRLDSPPPLALLRVAALGDEVSFAKIVMLWLQAFDTQAGLRIPLRALNYSHVIAWLSRSLALDPHAQYPLLAASRLYAEIPDPVLSRQMLEFVYVAFADDPAQRWPWLAHATYLAKHRLKDHDLALKYAARLAQANNPAIPHWAQQLQIFVLADMGEIEAAKVLLGGLLASDKITDPHEQRLLAQRLHELETAGGH